MEDDLPRPRGRGHRHGEGRGVEERLDPSQLLRKCKSIAAGKLAKITGDRLPIPTPKGTAKRATGKKPAAKPTATKAAK